MAEIVDFGLQQHKIKMDSRYFENVLSVVAGDTGRRLEVQLLDTNGMVQDTTGLNLRLNAVVAGKATFTDATLVDAPTGKYQLDLSNGMFLAPGNWQFQWQITDSAGKKLHSFAFTGNVGSNISEGGSQATNFYLNLEDLKAMQEDLVNGTIDSSILETTITEKLTDLETQYAPKLTEVTAQLAQTATKEEVLLKRDKTIPIPLSDLGQDVKEAILNGASVAVVGVNSTNTKNITRYAVTTDKMSYVPAPGIKSKNLFNKNDYTPNSDINPITGEMLVLNGFIASGFIPVDPNLTYTQTKINKITYWDANYNYISRESLKSFTTPLNCYYVRLVFTQADLNIYQLEKGTISTLYEEYGFYSDIESFKDKSIPKSKLSEEYVSLTKGKNLFNKETVTAGYYVDYRGTLVPSITHSASDFIEIKPNTTFVKTDKQQFSYYDDAKNPITGLASASTFTTPNNVKYIRMTILNTLVNTYQLEEGSTLTAFEPFGNYLPLSTFSPLSIDKLSGDNAGSVQKYEIKLQLPSQIDLVVGEEFSIYWRNVINHSQAFLNGNYYIRGQRKNGTLYSEKGEDIGYKWFYTPLSVEVFEMEFRIYDTYSQELIDSKVVMFNATAKSLISPKTITQVTIGDSFTDGYEVTKNLHDFLTQSTNLTINMIGLNDTGKTGVKDDAWSGYGYEWFYGTQYGYLRSDRPLSDSVWDTGWGENEVNGWTTGQTYWDLTAVQKTHGKTPNEFYDTATSKFNFSYYMNKYHPTVSKLDSFVSFVGLNDSIWKTKAQLESELSVYKTRIEHIVNSVKSFDTDTKIFLSLVNVQNESDAFMNTQGSDWRHSQRAKHSQEIWNQFMLNNFDTEIWRNKGVYVIATNAHFDPKYGIKTKTINPVKFDLAVTETVTNDVHPTSIGAKYMADVARNSILKRVVNV